MGSSSAESSVEMAELSPPSMTSSLDLRRIWMTCKRMSRLIAVESVRPCTVHRSDSLNCSSTAIWNVDVCRVYLGEK